MKKTHKVIMLPCSQGKTSKLVLNDGQSLTYNFETEGDEFHQPQHLYIVSDDEIKEGDWFMQYGPNNKKPERVFQLIGETGGDSRIVKIIATTDSSLRVGKATGRREDGISISLPQIPESFIKAYVEQGGIDEVQLEHYPSLFPSTDIRGGKGTGDWQLKLRDDGTVIVHQAKMYSREEVADKLREFGAWYLPEADGFDEEIEQFIEENL